jgi:hypothetical protein
VSRHGLNARAPTPMASSPATAATRQELAEDLAEAVGQRRSPSSEPRSRVVRVRRQGPVKAVTSAIHASRRSSRARGSRVSGVGRRGRRTPSCSGRSARSAWRPCEPGRAGRALLLDAVTSAQGPRARRRGTRAHPRWLTMLIATREMSFAREVADEVWFLHDAVVLERGAGEVLARRAGARCSASCAACSKPGASSSQDSAMCQRVQLIGASSCAQRLTQQPCPVSLAVGLVPHRR